MALLNMVDAFLVFIIRDVIHSVTVTVDFTTFTLHLDLCFSGCDEDEMQVICIHGWN